MGGERGEGDEIFIVFLGQDVLAVMDGIFQVGVDWNDDDFLLGEAGGCDELILIAD